jgi:hypothetical protein
MVQILLLHKDQRETLANQHMIFGLMKVILAVNKTSLIHLLVHKVLKVFRDLPDRMVLMVLMVLMDRTERTDRTVLMV